MLLVIICLFAAAAAAPATYDQQQDGEFNVQADIQNIMILLAVPKKMNSLLDMFTRSIRPTNKEPGLQDRAGVHIMEAFVEPNTPYQVEIGSERAAVDGRAVEVLIAGRRRMDSDEQDQDEYKLLGATEQCGPDRVRDPVTLICKFKPQESSENKEELGKTDDDKSQSTPDKIESQSTPDKIESQSTPDKMESQPTPEVIAS